ncbi:fibronectin type III domain-containing protein [Methanogenium marinum]|uniref:Fibronectin type III domain-containing protein n=1 Tax=Methanogenium marinum TaxID=348610 RepID=A0A9Q4KW74_9EURY|nr:fibronectin type III domain-containing protein [Methanogenium marinum]MDE4909015.1 fibronectin type III domain-containing protein [Methanogenium marinum]
MTNQTKRILAVLIVLLLCVTGATAAGEGTLSASDVADVALGESGVVTFTLTNDFDPKVGTLTYRVYYDETIATAASTETIVNGGVAPGTLNSGMTFTLSTTAGVDNNDADLFTVSFTSPKNDGSRMDVGIVASEAYDTTGMTDYLGDITIVNGTFTTKDEVAPVGTITTPTNVGKDFKITGTITDVGGMGSASAILDGTNYPLALTNSANGEYLYTADVSWPEFEDGITLTVNAVDAAGNVAEPLATKTINVKNIGFSDPSPADGSYINTEPSPVKVFMSQIDTTTVVMTLGGAVGPMVIDDVSFVSGYAIGDIGLHGDGLFWVNVTGTDTVAAEERFLNWTYTVDTSAPTLDVAITDSDGDGFIEANEVLNFDWTVSSPGLSGFKNVSVVEPSTGSVLLSNGNADSSATLTIPVGNRDLSFRAYDNAGNYAKYDFHLYNNYVVWVDSTKVGTIGGLDTEFTAAVDLDLTATSMVELYNGRSVFAPDIGTVTRQVKEVGQVTSDTYVTVDNRADATYAGTDTYQELWVYDPTDVIDFEITAPAITHASVMMFEANESYLNELIDSKSTSNIDYEQLIKQASYIFIDGGWTQISVEKDGSFIQEQAYGEALTVSGDITTTLKLAENQVDLSSGFRMSEDCVPFDATTTPDIGDYAIAAIAFDGDRIGGIAVMPVVVLESAEEGVLSATSIPLDGTFDASFSSDCKYFGVALYRDTVYDATATIDFANLNYDMVTLDLSAGGAATEKLWHNIYITPGAGKYAYVNADNSLTFDASGLEAGNYKAVLAGLSNSGTAQAFGVHDIAIGSSLNISNIIAQTGTTGASVTWTTNNAANSTVEYGLTSAYGYSVSDAQFVTRHTLGINGLTSNTVYHYRIISVDPSGNKVISSDSSFITKSSGSSGGGGGGGSYTSPVEVTTPSVKFTTLGYLQTDSNGIVQNPVLVSAADGLSSIYIGAGVKALDADGQPLDSVIIQGTDDVPSTGSFSFAGHAVELGPSGATFSPGIELTFQFTEEEWNNLGAGETFAIKWFNEGTGEWEAIPTTVDPINHTVVGVITHFSTFAVFKEIGEMPTSVATQAPTETPVPTETGNGAQTGGFPWVWFVVVIVMVAIIGAGYYYMQQQKK